MPEVEWVREGSFLLTSTKLMESIVAEKTLQDLFHDTLKDIYYAEKKILGALPKMAKAAQSVELKAAFEKHGIRLKPR